ncbi:TPA: hypothetical protein ACF4OU_002254 [Escherichia coli]
MTLTPALSLEGRGGKRHRLRAVLSFLRQALFRQTGNGLSAFFSNLLIIHIKIIGTPFANNLTSLSGVIND